MNSKISFLLALVATVRGSFLQTQPNQFHSKFNSTFLKETDQLFKPIIIPNITEAKGNEVIQRKPPQPNEISQESKLRENYLDEEPKTTGISLKFSSRYSTKFFEEDQTEKPEENQSKQYETSENSTEATNEISEQREFSDRSDDLPESEDQEEEDTFSYDEPNQPERSEIASTTNEPYSDLPTSFQTSPNDDFENYETTSTSSEETQDSSEEKHDPEAKRSLKNYSNHSKNYHSIQTPLTEVKYRGPHAFTPGLESEEPRTRLLTPFPRHHVKHNWPYSKSQIAAELEDLNEISDSDETPQKNLDEAIKEEVKTNPNLDLESAVEKDERNRNKKYNYIEEKNRRKQQQKSLAAAEAKDDMRPPFRIPKQYQVVEPKPQPIRDGHKQTDEDVWGSIRPSTAPNTSGSKFGILGEDKSQRFLGPVVFNQNLEPKKLNPVAKPSANHFRQQTRKQVLKGLLTSEKLDQDNLTNERREKSVFATQSFNHLVESDEMYNAILANIQAVFGVRTSPPGSGSGKNSPPEVEVDESKLFTWSLPLKKPEKVN